MKKPQSLRAESLEARQVMAVNVLAPLADLTFAPTESTRTIDLTPAFDLAEVTGTVARFTTNQPGADNRFFVELFDAAGDGRTRTTPATVSNFLAYIDANRYRNTIVHRSMPGFVVQGGGFTVSTTSPASVSAVNQFAAVVNEPGNTNARGTIAMAKLPDNPNSATNQWFFNLANNAANLDSQNGGFTAFGRVLGNGMSVVDALAAIPRFGFVEPFDTIPLRNVPGPNSSPVNTPPDGNNLASSQFVTFTSIDRVGELAYTITSSDPSLVSATLNASDDLVVGFGSNKFGTATITVRAASVFDPADFKEDVFTVTRTAPAIFPPAAVALAARSDSGASNSDRFTNATRPTFTGTAENGSVITVFAQRGSEPPIVVGSVKASPKTGAWTFATPRGRTFTPGVWTITATARNTAGIVSSPSAPLSITVKTAIVAPSAFALAAASDSGPSNSDRVTNVTSPAFTGTAEPGSTVSVIVNKRTIGTAVANATTGAFTVVSSALRPGAYRVSAVAVDAAGNRSQPTAPLAIVVDTALNAPRGLDLVAASDTGTSNKDNRTSLSTPTFAGTAKPNSTVEVYAASTGAAGALLGTATANGKGGWRFTVPPAKALAAGTHAITAIASDLAGNRSSVSAPLTIEIGAAFA
ncbi:MAG: Ig-like domain-containing protein [Planctomycetia bacterium]|jgi:cyclophilin family peptidyl-prolyl cis-trans isomerase